MLFHIVLMLFFELNNASQSLFPQPQPSPILQKIAMSCLKICFSGYNRQTFFFSFYKTYFSFPCSSLHLRFFQHQWANQWVDGISARTYKDLAQSFTPPPPPPTFTLKLPKSKSKAISYYWINVILCSTTLLNSLSFHLQLMNPHSTAVSRLCLHDRVISAVKINSCVIPKAE